MIEYQWFYRDIPCVCRINELGGWRCGYAGLDNQQQYYGQDEDYLNTFISVHGGVTYTGAYLEEPDYNNEDNGTWWIGFDCAHIGDSADPEFSREANINSLCMEGHAWTLDEVVQETEHLVDQLLDN